MFPLAAAALWSAAAAPLRTPADDFSSMVEKVMDRTASPCDDFWQYACGGWLASPASVIPADDVKASRVYQGGEMGARNAEVLHTILKETTDPLLSGYYQSCMQFDSNETNAVQSLLAPYLKKIDGMTTAGDAMKTVGTLHSLGVKALFTVVVANDLVIPTTNLFQFVQGGLGLPDSAYYTGGHKNILVDFENHIATMLEMANLGTREDAANILAFEKSLAAITRPNASTGDFLKANESYHKSSVAELSTLYPNLPFVDYLQAIGFNNSLPVSVAHPTFFSRVDKLLNDLETFKSYMRWMLLHHLAAVLPLPFGRETFKLYGASLQGQASQRPRNEQCLAHINTNGLANALGKVYVAEAFGPEAQPVADALFEDIRQAFITNLDTVSWLDDQTRAVAKEKAAKVQGSLGGPKTWVDYSALLSIGLGKRGADLFPNAVAVSRFAFARLVGLSGSRNTVDQWDLVTATPAAVPQLVVPQVTGLSADCVLNPQTVSAFNPESPNYLLVPAAELQLPEFNASYPPAMLLGSAGATVGHEFTHGFDNVGHNFGVDGALYNWWTPSSLAQFNNRSECIADQYSKFEPLPGVFIDGHFTLQEDIADNGGLKLAHMVYKKRIGEDGKKESIVKGVTNDQLFFLQFGQDWCFNTTSAYIKYWVQNNQHAIPKFRVKGAISNLPAFGEAFGCKAGAEYNPIKRCALW